MARPQSEAKLGFFPIPDAVLPLLHRHIEIPACPEECTILDPCAGEGAALNSLANHLSIPEDKVYAVELSESRTDTLRRKFPKMRILGPASFMGVGVSYNAFSCAYVNPPYADELGGGGREELKFLVQSINHIVPGGLLVLVVPETTVLSHGTGPDAMRRALSSRLSDLSVWAFPEPHRDYHEIVVFGRKRRQAIPEGDGPLGINSRWWEVRDTLGVLGQARRAYTLPPGKPPKRWLQTDYTPEQLKAAVQASSLSSELDPPRPKVDMAPPITLGQGHTCLQLVSGRLNGLLWPEGEPPHVIRGISKKITVRHEVNCEYRVNDDGSHSQKEAYIDQSCTVTRAVGVDGKIYTFTDSAQPEEADHAAADSADDDEPSAE